MASEYEHIVFDIRYPTMAVIAAAVRAVINGVTDMAVQVELTNFANEFENRTQHHAKDVQRETIARLNAEHKNPPPIIHINVAEGDRFEDLI